MYAVCCVEIPMCLAERYPMRWCKQPLTFQSSLLKERCLLRVSLPSPMSANELGCEEENTNSFGQRSLMVIAVQELRDLS